MTPIEQGQKGLDEQELKKMLVNEMGRGGRWALREYFGLGLRQRHTESFDQYPTIDEGMRHKITSYLNGFLQQGGQLVVVDFPYEIGADTARIQVLNKNAYLRQILFPTIPVTKDLVYGRSISTKLARPYPANIPGALSFEARVDYGQHTLHVVSANEEEAQKRRFLIISHKDAWDVLLDFRWPNESGPPIWKVNHTIYY